MAASRSSGCRFTPGSGHDDFALAAQKAQLAAGRGLGQIAGGQPLVLARLQRPARPGGARDHRAPHQHFAVWPQLHLAARQRLADRSAGHVEGMVQRDDRRGLRHSVALNHDESQAVPELLQRPGQCASAGDQRPELQPERADARRGSAPSAQMRQSSSRSSATRSARSGRLASR